MLSVCVELAKNVTKIFGTKLPFLQRRYSFNHQHAKLFISQDEPSVKLRTIQR